MGRVMDAELPKAQAARPAAGWDDAVALTGFVLVAIGQASNQVLARGLAGSVPPFSLAFFRWSIIAIGLAPFTIAAVRDGKIPLAQNLWPILAAGFLGMFLCGGPVYIAGITTTAIHIALIFALSPIMVLLISAALGIEHIGPLQWLGTALALGGALLIVSGGHLETLTQSSAAWGDLLVVCAMLGWSGYTLVQSRVAPRASLLARVSLFSAAGALCSASPALRKCGPRRRRSSMPGHSRPMRLRRPGPACSPMPASLPGSARFGLVRTSLVLYVAPIASALLSWLIPRAAR